MGYNCLDLQGPTIIKGMPPRNVKCFAGICTLQLLLKHHFYSRGESIYGMCMISCDSIFLCIHVKYSNFLHQYTCADIFNTRLK